MNVPEPTTETSSPDSSARFLIVTVGGRYLALDAECVVGLLMLEEAGNVDDPTIHGVVYRAISLTDRLGLSNDRSGPHTRIVLLSDRDARGNIRVAAVLGRLELQPSQVLPLPMQFRGPERHWYRGMILYENRVAFVLDTTWLLGGHVSGLDNEREQQHTSRFVETSRVQ